MPEPKTQTNSRPQCPHCERPLSVCLCSYLKEINNQTEILVLQHFKESGHALNTVRLMKKTFKRITVLTGEDFSLNEELHTFINKHKTALIYPSIQARVLCEDDSHESFSGLIFIDGTWKKAFKIFCLTPILNTLPALKLDISGKGRYRIRKAPSSSALSTLEACVHALSVTEKDLNTDSVMRAFEKMIDWQIEKMGPELYLKNYRKE